jgi:hypothetical protein
MPIYESARRLQALAYNKMGMADVEELRRNLGAERFQVDELMGPTPNRAEMMNLYSDIDNVCQALLLMLDNKTQTMHRIAQAYLNG